MDHADIAGPVIDSEQEWSVRAALNAMLPDRPQVVIAGDDGAPMIICYDCEDAIPQKRLAAYPHAIRCVDCQDEYERRI